MSIIDEMRKTAHHVPVTSPELIEKWINEWADRLAASGALVPVVDGEGDGYEEWCHSGSTLGYVGGVLAFNEGDEGFCTNAITGKLIEFLEDEDGNWGDPGAVPVRLVPITEAEI